MGDGRQAIGKSGKRLWSLLNTIYDMRYTTCEIRNGVKQ